jgi:hypothetical protein
MTSPPNMPSGEQSVPLGKDSEDWASVRLSQGYSPEGKMGEDLAGDFLRHTTTEHRLIADSSTHSAEPEIASPSAVESTTQEFTYM